MNLRANAALSLKGRRELCRMVVERERTVAQAAEAAGVSVRAARLLCRGSDRRTRLRG
jgi:leucine-zipper of insertion element IS481